MDISTRASRLAASIGIVTLAACGGGGGGGGDSGVNTAPTPPPINTGTTTPTVSIGVPDGPGVATQTQPVYNFTTNLPPVGTPIGIAGPAVKLTATSVGPAGTDSRSQAIFRGVVTSNGNAYPVFDLNIPSLSLSASNVRGDGTVLTLADGGKVAATVGTLNYTLLGAWTYIPAAGGTSYFGATATGSATITANIPTTGSATYTGTGANGGAVGAYFVPSGTGTIAGGTLKGNISITTNFATSAVNGSLTNMTATPTSGGATTPWNDVSLSGNFSRPTAPAPPFFGGHTGTSGAPANAGAAGFSNVAGGQFIGGFFGPNAEEVGGTWTLTEATAAGGGKTAFGAFAGTK